MHPLKKAIAKLQFKLYAIRIMIPVGDSRKNRIPARQFSFKRVIPNLIGILLNRESPTRAAIVLQVTVRSAMHEREDCCGASTLRVGYNSSILRSRSGDVPWEQVLG